MARRKKVYNLDRRITSALRILWFYSPMRREVVKVSKNSFGFHICALCGDGFKDPRDITVDHTEPVVSVKMGRGSWDEYITNLFYGAQQALCKSCHSAKTKEENAQRKRR